MKHVFFLLVCLPMLLRAQVPTVSIVANNQTGASFCLAITYRATANVPVARYDWFHRPGTFLATTTTGTFSQTVSAEATGRADTKEIFVKITTPDGQTAISLWTYSNLFLNARPVVTAARNVLCPGQTLTLTVNYAFPQFPFRWERDGTAVPANDRTLTIREPGSYRAVAYDPIGCTYSSEPFAVFPPDVSTATLTGNAQLCPGQNTLLTVSPAPILRFEWLRNDLILSAPSQTTFSASEPGTYRARLTDPNQCTALTNAITVTQATVVPVSLAPLPPLCAEAGLLATLVGNPAGGQFSGPGIRGNQFTPAIAGAGQHTLTYSVSGAAVCQSGTATQTAVVLAAPVVALPASIFIRMGETAELVGPTGPGYTYAWTPATGLINPTGQRTGAQPAGATTYTLRVRNAAGCTGRDTVRVVPRQPVFIPNAFSPNRDGLNDTWTLTGIENYPQADVTIFDRWGGIVFHSVGYGQPFDGTLQQQDISPGLYTWRVQLEPDNVATSTTGRLFLLR